MSRIILILVLSFTQVSCKAQQNVFNYKKEINEVINLFLESKHDIKNKKPAILAIKTNAYFYKELSDSIFINNLKDIVRIDPSIWTKGNIEHYLNQLKTELSLSGINCPNIENMKLIHNGEEDKTKKLYGWQYAYNYYSISKPLFSLDKKYAFFMYTKGAGGGYTVYKMHNGEWTYYRTFMGWIE